MKSRQTRGTGTYVIGARQGKRGLWRWSLKDGRCTVAIGAGSWRTLEEAMADAHQALRIETIDASEARAVQVVELTNNLAAARELEAELRRRVAAARSAHRSYEQAVHRDRPRERNFNIGVGVGVGLVVGLVVGWLW